MTDQRTLPWKGKLRVMHVVHLGHRAIVDDDGTGHVIPLDTIAGILNAPASCGCRETLLAQARQLDERALATPEGDVRDKHSEHAVMINLAAHMLPVPPAADAEAVELLRRMVDAVDGIPLYSAGQDAENAARAFLKERGLL